MSYASAVEPLRAANRLSGVTCYEWCHIAPRGQAVAASNGVQIVAEHCVGADVAGIDMLFVCAGGDPTGFNDAPTLRWLRELARRGAVLGGVSAGPYVLAQAGLLRGYRCTLHWEHAVPFREAFPYLNLTRTLYEIDRDRLTCSGGTAALDMMCAIIAADHGHRLAAAVSDWFLHSVLREGSDPQRMALPERYGVCHPRLLSMLEAMEQWAEEPLDRAAVAAYAGVSARQLERLCRRYLGTTIADQYIRIRLQRAHLLLRQTSMPVLEVAVACGFVSAAHFSRRYRAYFGHSPRAERANGTAP